MLSTIHNFEIEELNITNLPVELFSFMEKAKSQGMKNNSSVELMKIGKWGNEAWWVTKYNNEIISISGCHSFTNYKKDCWRLMVRTATLKEYRGKAPGSIKKIQTDFNWGHILHKQINYAKQNGAKLLVFTTNTDEINGDTNSVRTNRIVKNVLLPQKQVRLIDENVDLYYTKQNVWEILIV